MINEINQKTEQENTETLFYNNAILTLQENLSAEHQLIIDYVKPTLFGYVCNYGGLIISIIGIVVTFITLTTVRGYKSKQKLKKNIDNYLVEIRKFEKIFSKSNTVGTEYYEKLNSFILNFKIFIEKNQIKERKKKILSNIGDLLNMINNKDTISIRTQLRNLIAEFD